MNFYGRPVRLRNANHLVSYDEWGLVGGFYDGKDVNSGWHKRLPIGLKQLVIFNRWLLGLWRWLWWPRFTSNRRRQRAHPKYDIPRQ